MQIIKIRINTLFKTHPHNREPLWRETIGPARLGASLPLDALKVDPVVVGEGIQARAKGDAARGCSAVGVGICFVEGGVVVEVLHYYYLLIYFLLSYAFFLKKKITMSKCREDYLLDVDNVVAVLSEPLADHFGVLGLVAWDIIAVDDFGKAGDVEGEDVECAGGSGESWAQQGHKSEGSHHVCP